MLENLKTNHREIARLAFEGYKAPEIADQLNMTTGTVKQLLNDPLCKSAIQKMQDEADKAVIDVRKELSKMNLDAVRVIKEILNDQSAARSTQLKAAEGVLDRSGYSPKQQHEHVHAHLTKGDIEELKRRAFGPRLSQST